MPESRQIRIKRLLYQSWYRGCKETDKIIGGFAKKHIHELSDKELDQLEEILAENDNDIFDWCCGKLPVPEKYTGNHVFQKILAFDVPEFLGLQGEMVN
jgi:antitoxin CptB